MIDDVISSARSTLSADAILIDHTTTLPELTAERAERLQAQRIKNLHCPVIMGPPAARNAQGSMMVPGRGANMAKGNFIASFELAMARKDVGLMLTMAGNRPLAALPSIAARMDQLIAAGQGFEDASVLAVDAVRQP